MREGILRRGFTIITPNMNIELPKGTSVLFDSNPSPTISFPRFKGVKLFMASGNWFVLAWDRLFNVKFDKKKPPYPLKYFKT